MALNSETKMMICKYNVYVILIWKSKMYNHELFLVT